MFSKFNAYKSMTSYKISTIVLNILRLVLLAICIYSCTKFAQNPNQDLLPHRYTKYYYAMFTNVVAYSTIFVSLTGLIYRTTGAMRGVYNTTLPVILSFELLITMIFWICFFAYPSAVIYPKHLSALYQTPLLTELGIHLFPFCLLYLEQLNFKIAKSKFHELFLFGFLALYIMMICYFRYILGKFPYHVLNILTMPYLCLTLGGLGLICYEIFANYMWLKRRKYFSSKKPRHLVFAMAAISVFIFMIGVEHGRLGTQSLATLGDVSG